MTISAHKSRRIHRGATKAPLNSESGSRFSYRDLYPYMYKQPRRPRPSQHVTAIREWLTANGSGSAHTIAEALGYSDHRSTLVTLGKMAEMEACGEEMSRSGKKVKVWRINNGA